MNFSRLSDCCDALRASPDPEGFTMQRFHNACGTPGCVLGHYEYHILEYRLFSNSPGSMHHGTDHFGLSCAEARELFEGNGCGDAQTTQQAIAYIEDFIIRHGGAVNPPEKPT